MSGGGDDTMRGEEGEGAGGREGDTRRDAASAETAAVRRVVSAEPSMEARGTPEAELKRETAAWMEGRCGVSSKNGEMRRGAVRSEEGEGRGNLVQY